MFSTNEKYKLVITNTIYAYMDKTTTNEKLHKNWVRRGFARTSIGSIDNWLFFCRDTDNWLHKTTYYFTEFHRKYGL